MAKISVIIPLYNKDKYIQRCLDSVFAQTYQDYEIIVVDDGSTDKSPEIVAKYKDKRLRLISQENAGPGAARNSGIANSTTELLSFLDADDEWMPQFLQKSLTAFENDPDCDLTACLYFLGEKRIDISAIFINRGITEGPWQLHKETSLQELISVQNFFISGAILCKRQVVEKYGSFRTKNHCNYGEDTYLWLQVLFNHKLYKILEPLVWYHSEASQLGPGRCSVQPLQTFLTETEPIRMNCPPEYRRLLEQFLAGFALATAHEIAAGNGNINDVHYLLGAFPLMKRFWWKFAKLRLKIALPGLVKPVRYLKNRCSNMRDLYPGKHKSPSEVFG